MKWSKTWLATSWVGALLCQATFAQVTQRVSVATSGTQGNNASTHPAISADGRFVTFWSSATTLVVGDTNAAYDVFVHDRQGGTTERVSVATGGAQGNSGSAHPSISADGRFVAFYSYASNLVTGDGNGFIDVFVRDRQGGTTERVSVATSGTQGNSESVDSSISADGRFVAFRSDASNLVAGDTNGFKDIFVRDRQIGTTDCVSVATSGARGNSHSLYPSISADGRFVAFYSSASNLVAGDTNGTLDLFVHDRQIGTTERVSVDSSGVEGNGDCYFPSISADGRYVAFYSTATNLIAGDTNGFVDVFVRDRQSGTTERVSTASGGAQGNSDSLYPSISADGRFVAFYSSATNLVAGDTNGFVDVFVRDRQSARTERLSLATGGTQGNFHSLDPSISADGRLVAFDSYASNLVAGDTNGYVDAFVRAQAGRGLDLSWPAGSVNANQWMAIEGVGNTFAIVGAWTGRRINPYAQGQLQGARAAGLKTAAYCLLNFDNAAANGPVNQDGYWQVGQALSAVGSEASYISFMAIDVEPAYPLLMGPVARIRRIGEAVIASKSAGCRAIIYTKRNDWRGIASNTMVFSHANVPLWDTLWDNVPDINLDYTQPWVPYGGWTSRSGKQYADNVGLAGVLVDLDVFDLTLFP